MPITIKNDDGVTFGSGPNSPNAVTLIENDYGSVTIDRAMIFKTMSGQSADLFAIGDAYHKGLFRVDFGASYNGAKNE